VNRVLKAILETFKEMVVERKQFILYMGQLVLIIAFFVFAYYVIGVVSK